MDGVQKQDLLSLISSIEDLEEQKKEFTKTIHELFADAKQKGYDIKTIKKIIQLRKMGREKRKEELELLDLYRSVLDMD